uniref:Nuclear factor of activated T-cells 5 n=1 Tax=Denticeps clupeoides TaxID=299321 RepID=A0AAY4BCR1_9TELE
MESCCDCLNPDDHVKLLISTLKDSLHPELFFFFFFYMRKGEMLTKDCAQGAHFLLPNSSLLDSVYDLLPKERWLPLVTEPKPGAMSQKSGGGAGPPPTAALASDASSITSPLTMGSPCSAFPTSSSSKAHCSTSAMSERSAAAAGSGVPGDKCGGTSAHHHQMTPSKRPVLNISPPPEDLLDDSRMSCPDDLSQDSEQSNSMWMENSVSNFSIMSSSSYNDNTEVPRKARKRTPRQRPGPKTAPAEEASMDVFDADSAKGPHFVLSQLGPDSKAGPKLSTADTLQGSGQKAGGSLSGHYPQKADGKELKILVQPETQHRARYLTEGSRGSVKDRTQQGFPTVKLEGVKEPVVLQVFVGNDVGRVKPHGFYQACRVTGRNTTTCREVDIDGTTVIEISLEPGNNMTLAVDCVGILKLRNADVEARIGVAGSKKKSTRARLVFRVNIPRVDGSVLTLQTPSSSILCTQPAGVPEILKKSLHSCSVKGGEEVFIIGKNFLKGTKVIFQENTSDENSWKAEAEIDMELFHQNHLIAKVPAYHNTAITSPVSVGIYVTTNAGRSHDIHPFAYTPEPGSVDVSVKKEVPSPVTPCSYEQMKGIHQLFQPQMPMQCGPEAQSSSPSAALFQPTQQQQQQQQQEQAALFQQANELISIQTGFLQQPPSHPSPPLFHNPSPMPDTQDPQGNLYHAQKTSPTPEQVQAVLFPNSLTVLNGSSLSAEPPASSPGLFLSQASLPSQQQQEQQQMAFLTSLQTPGLENQSMFQSQGQLPTMQPSTLMEQQQSPQPQQPQPGTMFQNLSHSPSAELSSGRQQQAGLLFCNSSLSGAVSADQPTGLLFSSQAQLSSSSMAPQDQQSAPSLTFPQPGMINVSRQEPSEPMSFQDQGNPSANMQLTPSSTGGPEQSVSLFMAQQSVSSLQSSLATQELPQTALFATQNGVTGLQTTTSSPVQQPGSLFQSTVSGTLNQPTQAQQSGLFLFEIQNDCSGLMNSPGTTLSDQIIAISQSGQDQREADSQIQSLLTQTMPESSSMQNTMTTSQNMEKIDDLLVSLQEQGNSLSQSY